ncbi:phosphotransferase family protein [Actinomadura sp. WAC 06369]|uniref:phosphotransferase family protein n=1 Tax=Actinomadura sp. WAC 06369 TaxID=2203193 RepID=UPI000F7B8B89|nr:phosphotransferase family protein [Actinomadura sp. WAC 06369]RSN64362.1 phosphotransferase family protein [Actinomadura sp. WAC 06369]
MSATRREGTATGLDRALVDWMADAVRGRIVSCDRRPGGGRREAWFVDAEAADGTRLELFLRYDRGEGDESFTLHDEARFFRALQDTPVPVPRIHAVHPVEQAILAERVPGRAWFSELRGEERRVRVAREFMGILAALHAVDPGRLAPGAADADLRDLVHAEIDRWEALYRASGSPADPLVELGLGWVRANVPDASGPVVIVQGDTGPGNFLYEDGRVTAVLDWELAHLGDPHDDLAWVTLRAVQEPFTHIPDRLADYAAASGRTLDPDRIRYYRVLAGLRILILAHRGAGRPDPLGEVGNGLVFTTLHRRLFVEALADATGTALESPAPLEPSPGADDRLFDAAIAQIREIIVPRSEDPFVVLRGKGLARILKYLRESGRLADAKRARELDDLGTVLGSRPADVAAGQAGLSAALRAGAVPMAAALPVLHRWVVRETQVCLPAMGRLADSHYDPLA